MKVKYIIDFYKNMEKYQLFKSTEMHNLIVGFFLLFTILMNIFKEYSTFVIVILSVIGMFRLLIIHIHNMNVGFLDKYQDGKEIENISSYKRIAILNVMVLIEIILWSVKFHFLIIFAILAIFPTLYLLGKCLDRLFNKHINDHVRPFSELVGETVDKIENTTKNTIDNIKSKEKAFESRVNSNKEDITPDKMEEKDNS